MKSSPKLRPNGWDALAAAVVLALAVVCGALFWTGGEEAGPLTAVVSADGEPVDRVVTTIGFQPATQKHQQVLKLRPSSVVAVIDITYYSGDTPTGFAMVYMPHEVLDNSNVDLEDTDTVYRYYTELLETSGLYSDTKIRLGQARERLANILCIQEGDPLLLLEEVLYTEYDTPVLSQKLFFGPDQHELSIRRKNDRNMMKKSE